MKTTEQTAAPMSAEQAADLATLQAAADDQTASLPGAEAAPLPPDMAAELAALIGAFVAMAGPILPSLPRIYTEQTTATAAAAVAAVCEKHGWMPGGLMGEWGVEIGAAVVLVPLAIATVQGVKADMAENDRTTQYIEQKKRADLTQHMNIAHNLDGKTEPVTNAAGTVTFGEVLPGANA